MISKKSVVSVLDHNKKQLAGCDEKIKELEKEARIANFQRDGLKYNMAKSKLNHLIGMSFVYKNIIEDLESILKD